MQEQANICLRVQGVDRVSKRYIIKGADNIFMTCDHNLLAGNPAFLNFFGKKGEKILELFTILQSLCFEPPC